jgi:nucleoside-diphosphate-sugar epimerase
VRALLLGGTSFVGGRVVEHLQAAGHEVTVLNRGQSAPPPPGVGQLVADRRDPGQLATALAGSQWDVVVDVSGFVMAAGAGSFDALIDLLDGRVGRYVFVSSIMAYEPSGVFPWTEDLPVRQEAATTYGGFKVYAEGVLLERHRRTGFPATVARPAAIYGRENNIYDMEAAMFLRLRRGLPVLLPHEGLVTTSYGHVDDLCEGLLALATDPAAVGQVFNVTGEAVTAAWYVATLAEVVGVEADVVPVPTAVLTSLDRLPFGHLFSSRHHGILSCHKAQELLGLRPSTDFRTGHEKTYAWFCASPLVDEGLALRDPLWGAGFDLAFEGEIAAALRAR